MFTITVGLETETFNIGVKFGQCQRLREGVEMVLRSKHPYDWDPFSILDNRYLQFMLSNG